MDVSYLKRRENQKETRRCGWCTSDPLYLRYHDEEWGVPLHEERRLFELLILEGAQAGLSWLTVLRKRENYQRAFDRFDPKKIARYNDTKIGELLSNEGIIRNRLKVLSVVQNSRSFLKVEEEFGSFDRYVWRFVTNERKKNAWKTLDQVPSRTRESDEMSKDLLSRGFKFVGSTICYSFMQASGMVNDHVTTCFRYDEC